MRKVLFFISQPFVLPAIASLCAAVFITTQFTNGRWNNRNSNLSNSQGGTATQKEGLAGVPLNAFSLTPTNSPSHVSVPQPTMIAVIHNIPQIIPSNTVSPALAPALGPSSPLAPFAPSSPLAPSKLSPSATSPAKMKWNILSGLPTPDPAKLRDPATPPSLLKPVAGAPTGLTWNIPYGQPTPDPAKLRDPATPPSLLKPVAGAPTGLTWNIPYGQPTPDPAKLHDPATPPSMLKPGNGAPTGLTWNIPYGAPTPDPAKLHDPATPPILLKPGNGAPTGLAWNIPYGQPTPDPAKLHDPATPPSMLKKTASAPTGMNITWSNGNGNGLDLKPTSPTASAPTGLGWNVSTNATANTTKAPVASSPTGLAWSLAPQQTPINATAKPSAANTSSPTIAPTIVHSLPPVVNKTATPLTLTPVAPPKPQVIVITSAPAPKPEIIIVSAPPVHPNPVVIVITSPPVTPQQVIVTAPPVTPQVIVVTSQPVAPVKPEIIVVTSQPVTPATPQVVVVTSPPGTPPAPGPPAPSQANSGSNSNSNSQSSSHSSSQSSSNSGSNSGSFASSSWSNNGGGGGGGGGSGGYGFSGFTSNSGPGGGGWGINTGSGGGTNTGNPWWAYNGAGNGGYANNGWYGYTNQNNGTFQFDHNQQFLEKYCDPRICTLNDNAKFNSMSNEEECVYEIFYTNPIKCCRVIVEIGAGDGDRYSVSKFFEEGLHWKTLAIEANPDLYQQLVHNRPNASTEMGAFCETGSIQFDQGAFHAPSTDVTSEETTLPIPGSKTARAIPCLEMATVFQSRGIDHVDIMVLRVQGDSLAFIRAMDWTVRVDIWLVLFHGSIHADRDKLVRKVLINNEYVQAEWDIKRWCSDTGKCLNNEVFLRKGFDPLPTVLQRQLVDMAGRHRSS